MGPKLKKFPAMSAAAERLQFSVIPLKEGPTVWSSYVLGPRLKTQVGTHLNYTVFCVTVIWTLKVVAR